MINTVSRTKSVLSSPSNNNNQRAAHSAITRTYTMMYFFTIILAIFTILSAIAAYQTTRDAVNETHFLSKFYFTSLARRAVFVFILTLIAFLLTAHSTFSHD